MSEDIALKLKGLEADWNIEKRRERLEGDPLRRGRDLLRELDRILIQLLPILKDRERAQKTEEILIDLRKLEEHRLYMGEGPSLDEFWTKGSDIFQRLHSIIEF